MYILTDRFYGGYLYLTEQLANLKADVRQQKQENIALKTIQKSAYVLQLAEEKEALAGKVDRLITKSYQDDEESSRGRTFNSLKKPTDTELLVELEKLRTQNSAMRVESVRLQAELDLNKIPDSEVPDQGDGHIARGSYSGGREKLRRRQFTHEGHTSGDRFSAKGSNPTPEPHGRLKSVNGAMFYEGQAVTCHKVGSDSWWPAVIDSARLLIETVRSRNSRGKKTYVYSVWYEKGGKEDGIPEHRIRSNEGDTADHLSLASKGVNYDGETAIHARIFRSGDVVLARNNRSGGNWSYAEVLRRNNNGTYFVVFNGRSDEPNLLHPTMIRELRKPEYPGGFLDKGSGASEPTSTSARMVPTSLAKEAELVYGEQRETLLMLAREILPKPFEVGQEILAKYPGSIAWGPGVVGISNADNLHYCVDFDSGDFHEHLPFIFLRPRWESDLSAGSNIHVGDPILAQKQGAGNSEDWFPASFNGHEGDGYYLVTFFGEQGTVSVHKTRVRSVYTIPTDSSPLEIPANPPPPTKPLRAKKHHEGDIVLACIPTIKAWTPAIITGVKGRGRYSLEWADATKVDSLLFRHIVSVKDLARKNDIALKSRQYNLDDQDASRVVSNDGSFNRRAEKSQGVRNNGEMLARSLDHGVGLEASNAAEAHLHQQQRRLEIGEPVLAKMHTQDYWSPGSIKKVHGGGKYDIQFTDGTVAEDISSLLIRDRSHLESNNNGDEDESTLMGQPSGGDPKVGDSVRTLTK